MEVLLKYILHLENQPDKKNDIMNTVLKHRLLLPSSGDYYQYKHPSQKQSIRKSVS